MKILYTILLITLSQVSWSQNPNPNWMAGDTYSGQDSMWWLLGDDTIQGGYDSTAFGQDSLGALNTGSYNSAFGFNTMAGCCGVTGITGSYNSALGSYASYYLTSGNNNAGLGMYALYRNTTGNGNTAVGYSSLYSNIGNYNVAVGTYAGYYATASTSGIYIGNRGVATDTAVIRMGIQGTQKQTYIAGIYGVKPSGTVYEVVVNSSGQLGYSPTLVQAPVQKSLTEADIRRIVREELASIKGKP